MAIVAIGWRLVVEVRQLEEVIHWTDPRVLLKATEGFGIIKTMKVDNLCIVMTVSTVTPGKFVTVFKIAEISKILQIPLVLE